MARDLMSSKRNRNSGNRQQAPHRSRQNSATQSSTTQNSTTQSSAGQGRAGQSGMGGANMDNIDMNQVNSVMDSMRGKSEQEMQDELFRVADQQFKAGNVNMADIDAFAKQAAGMLNPEQQKRLNMLTGMLKNKAKNS